jgi:hypothetical protein
VSGAFSDGLLLPAVVLALIGWLVPRGLSLVWAEGVRPLMALALVATLIMILLSMAFFLALYMWQGVPLAMLFEGGLAPAVIHFGRLGLISALLWGPIMILSVAGLPKHWVKETW